MDGEEITGYVYGQNVGATWTEVRFPATDPSEWDSDGDGLPDGWVDKNNNGQIDTGGSFYDLDGVLIKSL